MYVPSRTYPGRCSTVRADTVGETPRRVQPGIAPGRARTYIDAADGDYKIKFGDGTVATIAEHP
ncbi:MAG TPA: hypothetical protein VIK33_02365 [Anaerolineae bacterium]